MSKAKIVRYKKVTRKRFIELLELIGYRVTRQSTDGHFMLIHPPGTEEHSNYWLLPDRLEHRTDNYRGGSTFLFNECTLELDRQSPTVAILAKDNRSVWCSFHNFDIKLLEKTDE